VLAATVCNNLVYKPDSVYWRLKTPLHKQAFYLEFRVMSTSCSEKKKLLYSLSMSSLMALQSLRFYAEVFLNCCSAS